jgi:hypothetical protein
MTYGGSFFNVAFMAWVHGPVVEHVRIQGISGDEKVHFDTGGVDWPPSSRTAPRLPILTCARTAFRRASAESGS